MQSGTYIALSGQLALQRRLETIASNVANVGTPGFRAEQVKFEALISRIAIEPVAFSSTGTITISRRPGELVQTGNPLDVAVEGEGWFTLISAAKPETRVPAGGTSPPEYVNNPGASGRDGGEL